MEYLPRTFRSANFGWLSREKWTKLDQMFERIDIERGFGVVIRTEEVDENLNFITRVRDLFPLLDARGRLIFEIGPFPDK